MHTCTCVLTQLHFRVCAHAALWGDQPQPESEAELEDRWRAAYEALGYKAAELLSPELAVAEGRFCPVFQAKR